MDSNHCEGESNSLSFERLETLKSKQKLDNIISILYSTHQTNQSENHKKPSTDIIKRNEWDCMEGSSLQLVEKNYKNGKKSLFIYELNQSLINNTYLFLYTYMLSHILMSYMNCTSLYPYIL